MQYRLLAANRALRSIVTAMASPHPAQSAAVVECASSILPLLRPQSLGILVAIAYAPNFSNALIKMAYRCEPAVLKIEFGFLVCALLLLLLPR